MAEEVDYPYMWFGYNEQGEMTPCEVDDPGCIGTIIKGGEREGFGLILAPYEPYKLLNTGTFPYTPSSDNILVVVAVKEEIANLAMRGEKIPYVRPTEAMFYLTNDRRIKLITQEEIFSAERV